MPVHIEEMSSEVSVFDGDLPLSPAQLDRLVQIVIQRLERQQQIERDQREATSLRHRAAPPSLVDE